MTNATHPATYEEYLAQPAWQSPTDEPRGCQINVIAAGSEPHILRNVARHYEAKRDAEGNTETWANALAGKLRSAARRGAPRIAANDKGRSGKKRAA